VSASAAPWSSVTDVHEDSAPAIRDMPIEEDEVFLFYPERHSSPCEIN